MKNNTIPLEDFISRYCKPTSLDENGHPTGQSFRMRTDETYLSVNWIDYFKHSNYEEAIRNIRKIFFEKRI